MDEIEWIKNTKKALIGFAKIFTLAGAVMASIGIIGGLLVPMYAIYMIGIGVFIAVGFTIFVAISFLILHIIYKVKYSGRKEIVSEKEYLRELPKQYSPALISLIYDLKIDIYKDYTATILYLCTNKYINIINNEGKYEFEILNTDSSSLSESERYVLDKIINKTKFDEFEFSNKVIEEAKENFLITDKEPSKVPKVILGTLIVIILFIILYTKNIALFVFGIILLVYIIRCYKMMKSTIKNSFNKTDESDYTKYKRARNGKELARKLQAFKNYINEYTLINEKEIDYIQILEEYIPYAVSLGEANTIEKFIKHNQKYRSLIYDRKIDE